ncbi:kinase non-catalytic C-lobe domain-containing protein 1 isoform X3 [Kryptolebias marmoratus]|uniref:kinase non-catalytic C-lobe domain-containing protein 1 isoform X3 n=1 Tax=Kryptolebias marmoratus TaxID=37003 RepID=UPI0018ACCBFF|nr:kinase non-catalytic C-lobe domain-containing protein 1 isoform X3 [Kryptolebias marmoratus]
METSGGEAADSYLDRTEDRDGFYDLDHLPPLLEDEENVSLADILSLRDSCLCEEEVWAVCAECVLALQSIRPSHLFYTLCITPDTLAFNAHGNVCFMEQLSDDPEGSFVPPEFDNTGSTFEGHIYSLGSTLSAALNFVIEPELEADLGEEIQKLLLQMQEEQPRDRPLLEDILSLAEAQLSHTSSAAVCRKLSSVGRRVLSIESVSNIQDGQEGSWEARWQHSKPKCLLRRLSSDDQTKDCSDTLVGNTLSRQQVCRGWDSCLWAEDMDSSDGDATILTDEMDCRSHNSSPVRRRAQQRFSRIRGALNRSCSVPDSNNPPCLSTPPPGDISVPVSDLTEIGADEHTSCTAKWNNRLQNLNRGKSCDSYSYCHTEDWEDASTGHGDVDHCRRDTNTQEVNSQDLASSSTSCPEAEQEDNPSEDQMTPNHNLYVSNNHITKSMLCLNEESQDEWISLRELLARLGQRLTVNELWALCYTCLSSLQTYTDFPAYLCLDTVYVNCRGEVLFLKPKNIETQDDFYLAPEYQDHGIITEKACVYGVAAVLWATAKFSLSPNQKLALPRKMKRLLLEMAKRTPMERPTIVMAKKSCLYNLSCQGRSAESVWGNLISRVHPPVLKSNNVEDLSTTETHFNTSEEAAQNSGFVPMATESRLAPVAGPVPHSYPVSNELQLPEAFTSTATHFSPIVLTSEARLEEEESQHGGTATEGTADGLTKNSDVNVDRCLGFPPHQCQRSARPGLHSHDLTRTHGTTSSKVGSPPALSDISHLQVSFPQLLAANISSCSIFNNYLFQQNPTTGHLSLVPVQVKAPRFLLGLDINPSLVPQPLQELIADGESSDALFLDCVNVPVLLRAEELNQAGSFFSGSFPPSTEPRVYNGPAGPKDRSVTHRVHPALQDVIDLLKGEFLDNGHHDLIMGEYIFSLKDLQYPVFSSIVRERFSDLHWEDDFLGVLHCLVNYSPATQDFNKPSPSKALKRPTLSPSLTASACRGNTEVCLRSCLDLNGNIHTSSVIASDAWGRSEARFCHEENDSVLEDVEIRSELKRDKDVSSLESGVMERGDHSVGGSDESPSDREERLMSPDCSEDMEDCDSVVSERLVSPGSRTGSSGLSFSSAWALAFYGEDCFSQKVTEYASNLGKHTGSPSLDVKAQEVQQQLLIETRNLKKTRNYYQKLIQQERKNKASENKLMISKLKSQLEELRSKVVFLDCVKKYLQVLSVDQWGLEVSLLPSLAGCGCDSLDLQSSEDSSVLSFGSSKGKRTLQAGSPLGLMAYLYARNVAVEGYIQQFLYTYRFFCTPEEFLQFVMDKFISAARDGADMLGDSERIFHRSLDLLHLWITDCRSVDFTPNSHLMDTLERFLNTEVIPVDSLGEVLLAALCSCQSPTTSSHAMGNLLSFDEDDDSVCLHSSNEDLRKKWKISRVVEPSASMPKEKAFCMAAALPMPCYTSLMHDFSSTCLQSEARLPFSQSEYSPQHVAQQLTLLQQEIFQECHPVHFLRSRTQGVRVKVLSPNRNVSHHIPPAESSSELSHPGTPSDSFLQQLITYADSVTNWISAEMVLCDSVKLSSC